jgi:thymidylate synthase ThyX
MKVTHVSIAPTQAATEAGRPALVPELLAATAARYSRSDLGLEGILAKIDPENPEGSIDSIFRMIDYGHQSIADMAPVAMFLDGVTIYLAYLVWSLCPTAGGQETSTRYVRMDVAGLPEPDTLGISVAETGRWHCDMRAAFRFYQEALTFWERVAAARPEVLGIPLALREDTSEAARKKVARMTRNYAFDRARYFLPVAATTNMMLVMSARGWVQLCQALLSHPFVEAQALGGLIRDELGLVAPRLVKHARETESYSRGQHAEFRDAVDGTTRRYQPTPPHLEKRLGAAPCRAFLDVYPPGSRTDGDMFPALRFHKNRYDFLGAQLRRTAVRYGWSAVAFAEIRDLNRHRTGQKFCPLVPQGFYAAEDQVPEGWEGKPLAAWADLGRLQSLGAHGLMRAANPTYLYWTLLGTQYPFEHLTTADKFLYTAELRTGTGAHFRYAEHFRDVLQQWYARFPETHGMVLEGGAEPE